MKTIDIVVLASELSPTTIAYLEYMKKNGYSPRKILVIRLIGKGTRAKYLNKFFGKKLTYKLIYIYNKLLNRNKLSFKTTCAAIQKKQDFLIDYFKAIDFNKYTSEVEFIYIKTLKDKELFSKLKKIGKTTLLYTGGGIVPSGIIDLSNIKILHVHPGIVPYVRGSDGIFWSIAYRGKLGVSCFYMGKGIDNGNLIGMKEFSIKEELYLTKEEVDKDVLTDALVFAFDPHLRAKLLIDIIKENEDVPSDIYPSIKQDETLAREFFQMHSDIKRKIIDFLWRIMESN